MLWLVKRHVHPGFLDGSIRIGLFESDTQEEAIKKAVEYEAETVGRYLKEDVSIHEFSVVPINQMMELMNLPMSWHDDD